MSIAQHHAPGGRILNDAIRSVDREGGPVSHTAPVPATKTKISDNKSLNYMVRSGLAGGMAGCAAKTVVAPLDRVKILFQTSNPQFAKYSGTSFGFWQALRGITAADGASGLFRGHSATLLRIFPYAGIKFLAYEQIRTRVISSKEQETHLRRFASGAIAGCVSVFFTYPLEVIRVRLAFETKREGRSSFSTICKNIYYEHPRLPSVPSVPNIDTSSAIRAASSTADAATANLTQKLQEVIPRHGLANFFRGFTPTLWGMLPYAGSSFLAHDSMGDVLRNPSLDKRLATTIPGTENLARNKPRQLRAWAELTAGGIAGVVSQTVSYPLEVIRRRMQVGGVVGDGRRLRMGETAAAIWKERGARGFFVGLGIGYIKIVPMAATSFFVYERGKHWLGI
ncbi:mitochondrial carrier [Aulographum hederae CBS 113979]|uniref:Mitochondrial thiamine pyrophosphate carrier 1 n=1 Tax=Aulographum hederae CBS 113979 TaxID=1176131 RepID=A0A6G1GV20_9PEZI|nr:mitochondrial carrier [Aulographum hederae CBS 113979]